MRYDEDLARALAQGLSLRKAGLRVGISKTMVRKRLGDPEFAAMLEAFKDSTDELVSEMDPLLDALGALRAVNATITKRDSAVAPLSAEQAIHHTQKAIEWVEEWVWLEQTEGAAMGEAA